VSRGPRVAFQGAAGAYSEAAVHRWFGEGAQAAPFREFRGVGDAVEAGETEFGVLPVDNTLSGAVPASYDVLARGGLEVVGEVVMPIHHLLLGVPGSALARVRRVLSHAMALAQCGRFFAAHPELDPVAAYDTAGAAADVARLGDVAVAAIAGRQAAVRCGLEVLAEGLEDRPDNQTRFLVVGRRGTARPPSPYTGMRRRTMVMIEPPDVPGAIGRVLQPFAAPEVSVARLESRPGPAPWTCRLFLELDGACADPALRTALAAAERRASVLRVLGSYPRWEAGAGVLNPRACTSDDGA
jgi:prephenate dehydratase